MSEAMGLRVVRSGDRDGWSSLVDPPGEIPSGGTEVTAFTSAGGTFTCGLWEREPDTWSFERAYDEVAYVLSGRAQIDTADGRTLELAPGDVLVTPEGAKGTWRIAETIVKFYAIYRGGAARDKSVRLVKEGDPVDWVTLETAPGDPNPPGQEWYAWRNADGRFSTGVWRRVPETGPMDLPYNEIAVLIDGEVEVLDRSTGQTVSAGPGDVLVTPEGFAGEWRAKSAVRKLWAVHHE
ncbi:MAG: cupin domain-containing protein [Actinobacteria bacterium]|nr:cupin domain-containing protein [Actinomycetota bacterium]